MSATPEHGLAAGFLDSWKRFPHRPALAIANTSLSYDELGQRAAAIASTLREHAPEGEPALTAVFASHSIPAYSGILAALLRGHGYVPLSPGFPPARTRNMLQRAGCSSMVVDTEAAAQLPEVLNGMEEPRVLLLPEQEDVTDLAQRLPQHRVLGAAHLAIPVDVQPCRVDPSSIAYLLFTSGSTGRPKGVAVEHRNVRHFIEVVAARYGITERDRFSQMFDLSFDLSVFDLFVAWERGACVCCPTRAEGLVPGRYINEAGLTVWFSVPSLGILVKKLRNLEPGQYPGLRWSLFCGEVLTADLASAWSRAAPNSIVENLYGPTELTVACTVYRWEEGRSHRHCVNGVVPIGEPYPDMEVLVADGALHEMAPGTTGELLVAGPQVAQGYWQDPEQTRSAFVTLPGRSARYYRTGDLVRRPADERTPLCYLGRRDQQLKIRGNRVELGEIEAALRETAGVDVAVALGWPNSDRGADGVEAFLEAAEADLSSIDRKLKARLPSYMVPRRLHLLARLPRNANGKVDRDGLLARLREGR